MIPPDEAAVGPRTVLGMSANCYTGHDMRDGYRDRLVLMKPFRIEELAAILISLLTQ